MKKHFADFLGTDDDTITGQHDLAHNMQLAYSDIFNEKVGCGKLIQDAFKVMSNYHSGKGSLVFLEAAAELDNVVLTNKSYQTTRFVMATLRGKSTYMTNLPTLYIIHSQTLSYLKTYLVFSLLSL